MRNERPTRAKLEASIRESFVARGIPHRTDVIDGPPMFDPFHEELVQLILNEMDGAWSAFVAVAGEFESDEQRRDAFWRKQGTINERALEHACGVRRMLDFDFSDVRAESDLVKTKQKHVATCRHGNELQDCDACDGGDRDR